MVICGYFPTQIMMLRSKLGISLSLLLGIVFGHLCFSFWGWQHYNGELLIFPYFRHEAMQECLFLQSRGLALDSRCRYDMLSWLIPLLGTMNITSVDHVATMLGVVSLLFQILMVAVVIRSITSSYLQERKHDLFWRTKSVLFALLYFLHPITIFACNVSMVPPLFHFLILLLISSAIRGWRLAAVISLTLLVIGNSSFFCVVPATLCCLTYNGHPPMLKTDEEKHISPPLSVPSIVFMSFLLLSTSFIIHSYFTGDEYWTNHMGNNIMDGRYHPSPGVFWYMDMETFPRFRRYFTLLLYCPPYILCTPIITRLSARPVHALSLTLAIVMYFRRATSFSDVVFTIAVITSLHAETIFNNNVMKALVPTNLPLEQVSDPLQEKEKETLKPTSIINTTTISITNNTTTTDDTTPTTTPKNTSTVGMRFLPLITLGITVPMVVSETMLKLWTVTGNGNANYLFFQGLAMWAFLATAIIEFTNATIRELDD